MKQLTLYDWRDAGGLYNPLLSYSKFIAAQEIIVRQRLEEKCDDVLILTTHPPTITKSGDTLSRKICK